MSREIKFRAWDKADDEMVSWEEFNEKWTRQPLKSLASKDGYSHLVWMQYTGLKDKNGVEIYEGDILEYPSTINQEYHGAWIRSEVIYKPGIWFISHISSQNGRLPRGYTAGELLGNFEYDRKLFAFGKDYNPSTDMEVIGNIYENKELLTKEN